MCVIEASWSSARRRVVGALTLFAVSGVLSVVHAEEPASARLVYETTTSSGVCPDAGALSNLVAGRLGYVPFRDGAKQTVRVRLERSGDLLRARLELLDEDRKVRGRRELTSSSDDCEGLVAAVAAAIGLALDPLRVAPEAPPVGGPAASAQRPAPSASAAPPTVPVPSVSASASASVRELPAVPVASASPASSVPSAPSEPVSVRGTLSGVGSFGTAPATAFGVAAQLGVRRGWASLGIEGRGDFPVARDRGGYNARSSLLLASLLPCGHQRFVFACAAFAVGSLQAEGGGVAFPAKDRATYAAVGARLGVEVPVSGVVFVTGHATVLAALTRLDLRVAGHEIWETPPLSLALAAGLGASF